MEKWLFGLSAKGKGNVMNHMLAFKASAQSDTSHSPDVSSAEASCMAIPNFFKVERVKSSFSEK